MRFHIARAGVQGLICVSWATLTVASLAATGSPQTAALTVPLDYQEVSYSVMNSVVTVSDQSNPFKKEPQISKGKARRGRFDFQIPNESPLAFLWDRAQGKLYLDLNRNEDLTDDPAGTFSSSTPAFSSSVYHGMFTNVHLNFQTEAGRQTWLVDLQLSEYRSHLSVSAGVRSLWTGKAVLSGREWQVGMIGRPQVKLGAAGSGHLLLRPWERRNDQFSVSDGSLDAFPFSKALYLQTRSYQTDYAFLREGDKPQCQLTFQEQSTELGDLKLTGAFIQRMLLSDGPCVVVLDAPAKTVRVPVGRYGDHQVRLGKGVNAVHLERSNRNIKKPVLVAKDQPATLAAGGPLTNSVTLTRRGDHLVLNYRLLGADGESYQLGARNYLNPPQFAVYQGDKKIASGKFEFG